MDSNQQELVAQFTGVTGASPQSAQTALQSANWNLQDAVQLYFAAQEGQGEAEVEEDDEPTSSNNTVRNPADAPSNPNPARPRRERVRQMTLGDLQRGDGDDEEDDGKQQDMFAGGEKSGLAVQNPDQAGGSRSHFENIMRQAQQNRERPAAAGETAEPPRSTAFSGRAQTLGGEGTESQVIEDPMQRARERLQRQARERVTRTLHLWADGVSIDDGPLFRFDDPANADLVDQIHRGRAPLELLDVEPDQEVDLNLEPHKDENYVQPKKVYKPFGGQGQRLGSPTPGGEPSSSSTTATSSSAAATPASSSTPEQPKPDVDESAPTLQLQIRLADGTRLPSRFNTTHTIGDVYAFVNRASPASNTRAYALMTTFPSKELDDKSQVLGEMGEFKRGGVVVQKWK